MFMCLVILLVDARPFVSNNIALILSWCTMDGFSGYPCASKNYHAHRIAAMLSWRAKTSASVELVVLIFWALEIPSILPFPKVM